jgi:hypothetical protein
MKRPPQAAMITALHQIAGLDIDGMEDADEMRRALLVVKDKARSALGGKRK